MTESNDRKKISFTDRMRVWFRWYMNPIAKFLNRFGITPNAVTIFGLLGTIGVAILISYGHIVWAGFLLLIMGPVDAIDGALARLRKEESAWGAFVDSVTDRYSELFIYGGFLLHYLMEANTSGIILAYLAAAGSVLVSYIKARAEASKLDANIGILTRVERYIVLIPGMIFSGFITTLPIVALVVITIFAHFTALQRIMRARADAHKNYKFPPRRIK